MTARCDVDDHRACGSAGSPTLNQRRHVPSSFLHFVLTDETARAVKLDQRAIEEAKYLREHVRDQIAGAKRQRLLLEAEMRSREFPPRSIQAVRPPPAMGFAKSRAQRPGSMGFSPGL